ncbi:hypothetical protein, conserved [Trypanosoma brucei gambiense DAL972]|uniref:Uncharacterized protein n=2 Tax=Trypanosoma brucei TaxID=5691 RepID=C9ZVC6_TRYB9|nr:hypothetical protein, conserved [Trypanosoma brucei gambiense DAL972]RHW70747.1 hypothetical protein DPX39_080036200 [Trypanosoma brucei equiperdum]CBH13364.1 hypothetical protein, conserved [Trypanosoma brucei gambiense DAL972]|eukprot:XP_011775641.1 hypothetical protein, conserved [Trypanosoma brucei gambiense DAL972]
MLWGAVTLLFPAVVMSLLFITAGVPDIRRCCIHSCVAAALVPLAVLVAIGISIALDQCILYLHEAARSSIPQPPPLRHALLQLKPDSLMTLSFLDVQIVAIFLFVSYGLQILLYHLVDIVRYLKISRRRLVM